MLIEKAQIYVEMEEYERCAEISQKLIGDYQVYAAYANELEAAKRQWNAAGVIQNGRACLNYFPTYVKAYEMMAKVYMDLTHPEELKELLQQAKDNNVKSVILDAYEWQLTNTGLPQEQMNDAIDKFRKEYLSKLEAGKTIFYRRGLPIITEYLYAYPCEFYWWSGEIFIMRQAVWRRQKRIMKRRFPRTRPILLPGKDWHGSTDAAANTMKP